MQQQQVEVESTDGSTSIGQAAIHGSISILCTVSISATRSNFSSSFMWTNSRPFPSKAKLKVASPRFDRAYVRNNSFMTCFFFTLSVIQIKIYRENIIMMMS